jgi:HK97 family phage prohead protease
MRSNISRATDLEVRAATTSAAVSLSGDSIIKGTPIVFNRLSEDLGGFKERILPQAVDRSINADIRALVDHDSAKVLGRTRAGTLALRKDTNGLRVKIEPDAEISYARDILRSVARGDVSGMSFAFRVIEEDWREVKGEIPIRDVIDMEISEVSIVTFPAYSDTDVQVAQRALRQFTETHSSFQWRARWAEILNIANR